MVTYDDFAKLQIKIGTIVKAERVEKSDKLLLLKIDLAEDSLRQVVSGIYPTYTPESLIGKQVPVLVNLEPRKVMGIQSNGMILACGENQKPVLLHPDRKVENGKFVK